MTKAETIARCVPQQSNPVNEYLFAFGVVLLVLYVAVRLIVRIEDKSLTRKVNQTAVR